MSQPYKKVRMFPDGSDVTMRPRRNALKRRFKRRRRRTNRYRRIGRSLSPYSIVRRLISCYSTSLDPASGFLSYAHLNLNSAYDPTGSLTANQPLGFDQYTALYKRYCVIGWSLKLEWCSTDNTIPIMVGFTPLEDTTKREFQHYKELPHTVSSIVTPDIDKLTQFTRGGIKRQMLPGGGKLLSDDTLSASVSANPSRMLYGHIWAQPMDTTVDPTNVKVVLTLYQTIVFFVPETPARSA